MKAGAVGILLALADFLNFHGADASLVKLTILKGSDVTQATTGLFQVEHKPTWIDTLQQETFQNYTVFTDTYAYGLHVGYFQPIGVIESNVGNRPISVRIEIQTSSFLDRWDFSLYNQSLSFDPSASGYVFITIPGTTNIYYTELLFQPN